ncbi:phosphodiesterase [Ramlibacter solisilvae]|uniref:Metallophosphatase n=1 Tax=Ramlibacter tataouinensis TaxID=94132 RepID=A0A127JYN6_9BURK|nr:phosphodiesterase [Ramlibacter tataouinensis]AMO25014.1 metallophosphatase [Ramlibacter tataouinensis]
MMTTVVQLSDLHVRAPNDPLCGRIDTGAYLSRAVSSIQALPLAPDAVVITGDLVDLGRPEEYRQLRGLLAPLTSPLFLLAGNHDEVQALRAAFPDHPHLGTTGDLRYCAAVGGLLLIALDTTVPRQAHGALDAQRLDWLARALDAARDQPVLLAMHHPPFRTFIDHMDAMGLLQGAAELDALLRAHANVERVICGHVHRPIETRFGGTIASICPSPAHQIEMNLRPDAPPAWTLEPGGFTVHAWTRDTGLVSHLAYAGKFDGPYAFDDDG